jgi:sacsin
LKVNNAVNRALVDTEYSFDHSFEATIQCRSAGQSNKNTFIVHHNIQCDFKESSLREWARNQKLIPGVAVAAKLPVSRYPRILEYAITEP